MKRILFIITIAITTVLSATGRSPETGYRGFAEWNNSITPMASFLNPDRNETVYFSGISTSHGYQINPIWFVGAGLSIENNRKYDSYILPIFVEGRADLQFGKFTPFADLRTGMSLTDGGGLYLSPSIGHRFNWGHKFSINVAMGATIKGSRIDLYELYMTPNGYVSMYKTGSKNAYKGYFSFRIGIEF